MINKSYCMYYGDLNNNSLPHTKLVPIRNKSTEDIDAEAKKQEEKAENINNEQKSADNKIIETVVEETAVPTENSDAINGEVISNGGKIIANGGQNGEAKHLLQTDI